MVQLLRQIQSLAVSESLSSDRESILNGMRDFVTLDRANAIQQTGLRSYDEYTFFVAATHLLLASLEPMQSNHLDGFRRALAQFRTIDSDELLIKYSELTKAGFSSTEMDAHVSGKQSQPDSGDETAPPDQAEEIPSSQSPGNEAPNTTQRPR